MSESLSSNEHLPQLLREAERRVNAHVFKGAGDSHLASIPANYDTDTDLLLIRAADEIERLQDVLRKCSMELAIERRVARDAVPPEARLTYSEACALLARYAIAVQDRHCLGDSMQPEYMAALKACTDAMGVQPAETKSPDATQQNSDAADLYRLRRKNIAVRRWHELAVSMGYDGVEPALLSLQAMTKGPRPAVTKSEQCWLHSASDPDPECIHCTAHEKVDDFTSHPGFAKLTDAVIAEMRWTCAHGNVYERWVATAACGCDRPTVETEGGL